VEEHRRANPGYHPLGDGRQAFEAAVDFGHH
jgi:hypothetical protein